LRIAAGWTLLVGGGEPLGRDHHAQLQQQRHQRQDAGLMARDQGDGNAQRRERKGEIMAAKRVQDIDAAGEHRVAGLFLWRNFFDHCVNPCQSLAFAPFQNA